jgi:hypothetical protein
MYATDSAENVRARMEEVRHDLGRRMAQSVTNVRTMLDWRHYVATHPWLCVTAAAATGFLVVPRRRPVVQLSREHLAELSKRAGVTLRTESLPGATGGALTGLATAAATTLMRIAASRLAEYVEQRLRKGNGSVPKCEKHDT